MTMSFEELLAMSLEKMCPARKKLLFGEDFCKPEASMMLSTETNPAAIPMLSLDDDESTVLDSSMGSSDSGYTSDEQLSGSSEEPPSCTTATRGTMKRRLHVTDSERSTSPVTKRRCLVNREPLAETENFPEPKSKFTWRKHHSDSDLVIKQALNRAEGSNLIGDFTKQHRLPTFQGKHTDLAAISSRTMYTILEVGFPHLNIKVIDCRFPYEYEGGHIKEAMNLYTKDQIMDQFFTGKDPLSPAHGCPRQVLIFHCEFSSERGPKMLRFLRQQDRTLNKDNYPALHYPEVYILEGGYRAFWEHCNKNSITKVCQPQGYTLMLDEAHMDDLKFFRKKSKSFSGGEGGRRGTQRNRKRMIQPRLF